MREMIEEISKIAHMVGTILPEGRFKDTAGRLWDIYISTRWYKAMRNGIIVQTKFEDGVLCIKLNNGLEFYGLPGIAGRARWWKKYKESQGTDKEAESIVFRSLYMRIREQFIAHIYEKNCRVGEGDVVVDVGAGWGINTVDFSRKVGNGRVIAIEPDKDSLAILRKNLEVNGCENVTIIEKGAWSKKDRLKFYLHTGTGSSSAVIPGRQVIEVTEIEVDTLDNILEELGIDKVTLIKMDIEGAEIEALKGMDRVLSKDGVKLAIASYHKVEGQPTHKTIITMMQEKGFRSQLGKDGILYLSKLSPVGGQALRIK